MDVSIIFIYQSGVILDNSMDFFLTEKQQLWPVSAKLLSIVDMITSNRLSSIYIVIFISSKSSRTNKLYTNRLSLVLPETIFLHGNSYYNAANSVLMFVKKLSAKGNVGSVFFIHNMR